MAVPVGGIHNITVYESAGFHEEFELFEEDETTAIPFADGAVGKSQIRASEKKTSTLLADFDVVIADNKLTISLSAEDASFNVSSTRTAYYDIFVTEPGQEPVMFMEGKVKINPAVTAEE